MFEAIRSVSDDVTVERTTKKKRTFEFGTNEQRRRARLGVKIFLATGQVSRRMNEY